MPSLSSIQTTCSVGLVNASRILLSSRALQPNLTQVRWGGLKNQEVDERLREAATLLRAAGLDLYDQDGVVWQSDQVLAAEVNVANAEGALNLGRRSLFVDQDY